MPLHVLGRARLRPSRQRRTRLSRSFALPKPGPPNLGGRGSVRAGKGHRGSAGASPSQNLGHRTWEGEAPSEPAKANAAQQELRPPKTCATELGRARLRPSRQRRTRLSRSFALPESCEGLSERPPAAAGGKSGRLRVVGRDPSRSVRHRLYRRALRSKPPADRR